ncbi:MAG TPA: DUF4440 domain-containing protein [Lysobacter sp.]|nr:DUF4440 domain-containing protein [Lysobacter sp.]
MPFALGLVPLLAATAAAPPPPEPLSADECAVFMRELSFARSVAEHDEAAFARHIAPDAVFGVGSPRPQRGREAIANGWARIVRGDGIRLEWYPARTTVSGDLAWSTGPALTEVQGPDGPRLQMSTFQSVWRRGGDGVWQVVFDGGTPPRPADAAAAEAFRATRPIACPAA